MRCVLPVLLLALAAGCTAEAPPAVRAQPTFSADVRENFLTSCVDNARNTSDGAATEEQLSATCACILGRVEAEYSQEEFADFEQRLAAGTASDEESGRLTTWSTDCAREATG